MSTVQGDTYKTDGVDVVLGDNLSAYAGELCRSTFGNNPHVKVHDFSKGHFRGPRAFELIGLPSGTYMDMVSDGIGTKVVVTDSVFAHRQSNRDLLAMVEGDVNRWGGKMLLFNNDLSVSTLGGADTQTYRAAGQLLLGLKETIDEQGYVMWKGESSEQGPCVSSENPGACLKYVWSGTALGCYNKKNLITGDTLAPGQRVIALREYGFRSNGWSSVRVALYQKFGEKWYSSDEARPYIEKAVTPSALYGNFLANVNGWSTLDLELLVKMHLIVHLTGGSFKGKFYEDILLERGLSAELDNLWDLPEMAQLCSEWRGISSRELYQTLSGGQGMLVVVDRNDEAKIITLAHEAGIAARGCGEILPAKGTPELIIHSKFKEGEIVRYP